LDQRLVNAIHTNVIETVVTTDDIPIISGDVEKTFRRMITSRYFGTPGDVVDVAQYLVINLSPFVNGESLVPDSRIINTG